MTPAHANCAEAFSFTMMHPVRKVIPHEQPMPDLLMDPGEIRKKLGEGHGPGPLYLGPEAAEKLLESAIEGVREVLAEFTTLVPSDNDVEGPSSTTNFDHASIGTKRFHGEYDG
jgi:hypothetical protein